MKSRERPGNRPVARSVEDRRFSGPGRSVTLRQVERWRKWADNLRPKELVPQLHENVKALNRIEMNPSERLRMLESLRPAMRRATSDLTRRLRSQFLPLPREGKAVLETLTGLLDEFVLSCDIVAVETRRRAQVAIALERGLMLRGERLLRWSQVYAPQPEDWWRETHSAYRLARDARVAGREVSNRELVSRERQSPRCMYKRLLLFSLADTQHLPRDDIARLYRSLETWCLKAHLDANLDRESIFPAFAADLEGDGPPRQLESLQARGSENVEILIVDDLLNHLRNLVGSRAGRAPAGLDAEWLDGATIDRLITNWWPCRYPRDTRASHEREVDVALGLRLVHRRLTGWEPGEDQPGQPASAADELSLVELDCASEHLLGSRRRGVRPGVNWNLPDQSPGAPGQDGPMDASRIFVPVIHGHGCWLLQDLSASGLRLRWNGGESQPVAVGEIAAIRLMRSERAHDGWCAGIIRRVQCIDETRFELGVHLISRRLRPTNIRRLTGHRKGGGSIPREREEAALLLAENDADRILASVAVPAYIFEEGDHVELEIGSRVERMRLGELREETKIFGRFVLLGWDDDHREYIPVTWSSIAI